MSGTKYTLQDIIRETIEDILLKTGKHNQEECSELADLMIKDLPKSLPVPTSVSDAVDPMEFHKWMLEKCWYYHPDEKVWCRSDNYHQWPPQEVVETKEKLYELFKKQKVKT